MERIRLGGMALANGVLVHGPTSWACAVRLGDGSVKVASGAKRRFAPEVNAPLVRGPLRMAESVALLPEIRRRLPEARFPFERPGVLATLAAGSVVASAARRSALPGLPRELIVAVASLVPAALSLRGGEVTGYHGAEHVSIGTYEQGGEPAGREHERCGSHLVGPLLVTSAAAAAAAQKAPPALRPAARVAGAVGALGASVEIFLWMSRNGRNPLARALALPGTRLQRHLSTGDPLPEQLEVAEAALAACLELERAAA